MDIQKLIDTISFVSNEERSKYHLTLGQLIVNLKNANPHSFVEFDNEEIFPPNSLESYRGYYSDLAFSCVQYEHITVEELISLCENALNETFEGYKGGDFLMTEKTPLWVSQYGCVSSIAVMGSVENGDKFILLTKKID